MKFPNSDALTAMIEDELEKGIYLIHLVEKIADDPQKVKLNMLFFPLKIVANEDGAPTIFIPLGTSKNPDGISTTECKYAMVFDKDVALVFHIDILKGFVKANYKQLEWTMDKWYEKMGFVINLRALTEYERLQRTK